MTRDKASQTRNVKWMEKNEKKMSKATVFSLTGKKNMKRRANK